VDVSWTKLTDLSTHEGKLLGASCSNSFVGVWVVDLARCEPFHSGKDVGPGGGGTRDAPDRRGEFDENRPPPTHSGRAEEAVAAAALAAKARVEASEDRAREASARPSHLTSEPRGSAPGSSARVELNDGAGAQSRMEMNTGFAAAHGIGADPMADKPPTVVYANPKPTTPLTRALNLAVPGGAETRAVNEDSGRPESRDQSDWETDLGDGDESDADEVIEEDIPTPEPEPDVIVSPPGGLHDSMELRRSMPPPTIEVHESPAQSPSPSPVKAQVSAATRQSRERKRYVHTATGMGSSRAFDLDVLRSAALEATSEFVVNESGAEANEETNTLAAAMARARSERERANNGGVGDGAGIKDGRVATMAVDRGRVTERHGQHEEQRKPAYEPPKYVASPERKPSPATKPPPPSEEEVLKRLGGSDGGTVSGILTARLTTLTACKNMWVKGDTRGVAETLVKSGDQSAVVDVATAAMDAPVVAGGHETLSLELAAALTPSMRDLLKSPHASYVDLALRFTRTVSQRFMSLLRDAPRAMDAVRRGGIGVDLVGEERASRAWACRGALEALRPRLDDIDRGGGELAPRAREMRGLLDQMSAS
jgi:katanin p80 WD40 repeat-containing subunit B1